MTKMENIFYLKGKRMREGKKKGGKKVREER